MKTTTLVILLVLCLATTLHATNPRAIDLGFIPEFIDFSPDDKYMVAENENHYSVWNTETNSKVLDGKYMFKIGRFVQSMAVPTGSGYFLFGEEKVFMTVDYQRNKTEIKAYDLRDGSLLWETNQLDMGVTIAETIISAHAGGILDVDVNGIKLSDAHQAKNFFTKDRFLNRLINYVPEKHAIALNGKNGLQLVDIRNGQINWTQGEFKGGIGEMLYDAATDKLFAITIPATEGALDLLTTTPEVIAVEANTGELLWKVAYTGEFVPGYASMIGTTLVLPYLELMFIDTETGIERDGDVKSRLVAAKNLTKGLGGLMALDKAMGGNFGATKDEPSKYNRLILRQLHFNNDGKLCYFTMFNQEGTWGTGGRKGYTVIDIHQDKIETEEYDILGSQWSVLQDDMADGIFYVKASGNMNRTIIKAIDAQSGEEIFETERARNSGDVSNSFNPFLIDAANNRLIDVVSNGVYTFDAKTGEKIAYTATKDLGVGTIKFSEFFPNGLLVFGTKGVGILDFEGNILATVSTNNLKGFAATTEEILLLESRKFARIDAQNGTVLEDVSFRNSDQVTFSSSGKILAKNNGTQIKLFRQ